MDNVEARLAQLRGALITYIAGCRAEALCDIARYTADTQSGYREQFGWMLESRSAERIRDTLVAPIPVEFAAVLYEELGAIDNILRHVLARDNRPATHPDLRDIRRHRVGLAALRDRLGSSYISPDLAPFRRRQR